MIAIMLNTAHGTAPLSHRQGQLIQHVTTMGAGLTRGIETWCYEQLSAFPFDFVGQLSPKLRETHIAEGAGKMVVLHYARHVQVFNDNGLEALG